MFAINTTYFSGFFFFFFFLVFKAMHRHDKMASGLAMITILSAGMKCCILDVQCPTFRFALAFLVFQSLTS